MEILLEKAIFNRNICMPLMTGMRLFWDFISIYILSTYRYCLIYQPWCPNVHR